MDYQDELKKLSEGSSDFWKPKPGQFKVKALSEIEEAEPFVKKVKNETTGEEREESTPQYRLRIAVGEEEKIWTFGKGKTPASTFGQLVELAAKNNNQLSSVDFSVVVKSNGNKNDYTIVM